MNKKGFTLIEILITIAIIGIVATIVVVSLMSAIEKAKSAKAVTYLRSMQSAISVLKEDTNKYPYHINGDCTPESNVPPFDGDTEMELYPVGTYSQYNPPFPTETTFPHNGLTVNDGTYINWEGPYVKQFVKDPWGQSYWFDPEYCCGGNCLPGGVSVWPVGRYEYACKGLPSKTKIRAIVSWGKDNQDGGKEDIYGGDNIAFLVCRP